MRLITGAALLAALMAFPAITLAAQEDRPSWCQKGWECVKTEEMVKDAEFHLDMRQQVLQYKQRARRFGITIGPGFGVGAVVDQDLGVHYVFTPGIFAVWGLRF